MCLVSLHADGKKVREFEIELAEGEPGFWVFSDISEFMGKRLGLYCGGGPNVNRCYKKAN
jgi:fructan beta-fructosidase